MAGGGGGGGDDVVPVPPRAEQPAAKKRRAAGRRRHAAWLPLDVIVEIAARSDAVTLVRCAATCREARRRIAEDPNLRGRLRLRDTERFVLPLLRGHLVGIETYVGDLYEKTEVYLVDTTAADADADATRLVKPDLGESETLRDAVPMDSRGGLVLVRATSTADPRMWQDQLLVCNPGTGRRLELPLEPAFPMHGGPRYMDVQFVLLVGDSDGEGGAAAAAVGRPFQVVMAELVLSKHRLSDRRLLVHVFSSEHGAWSPLTVIPTPNLHGNATWPTLLHHRPLVVGDVVHWLCLTDVGSYVLMLDVRASRVKETALPASFPRESRRHPRVQRHRYQYLLATASAGGNPVVLVADKNKVSAWDWEQSRHTKTKMWKPRRPQVVMENRAMIPLAKQQVPDLVCFAEILRIHGCRLIWLDLHSKKIVRSLGFMSYVGVYCPYEMDASSWVPNIFSRAI